MLLHVKSTLAKNNITLFISTYRLNELFIEYLFVGGIWKVSYRLMNYLLIVWWNFARPSQNPLKLKPVEKAVETVKTGEGGRV